MFGTQRDRLAEALRGLFGAIEAIEQDAEVRVGIDMVGTQAYCRSVGSLGFLRPANGAQQDAEVVVRVGVTRVDRDGTFVLGDRIPESTVGLQNNPEIAVPVRLIRAEREALPDEVDGLIGSALLVRQQAGVVKSRRLMWHHIEHP